MDAAARRAWLQSLSRRGLLRPPGSIFVDRTNIDQYRATYDFDRIFGTRAMDKEAYLAAEKHIWSAAMDFLKSKNICCEYDLVPDKMTSYRVVFEGHVWRHCNLLGRKRDLSCPSFIVIFVEVKSEWEPLRQKTTYDVVSGVSLDENSSGKCRVCPYKDVMHPENGGFICGSEDGQDLFFHTLLRESCSSDPQHDKTTDLSSYLRRTHNSDEK